MKKYFAIPLILVTNFLFAQSNLGYLSIVANGDSLYNIKAYKQSGITYSLAFKLYPKKTTQNDLYDAACSWALCNNPDSAFSYLNKAIGEKNYYNVTHIMTDADLLSLHNDKRWLPLIDRVKANKVKTEAHYNILLVRKLDTVYNDDQECRQKIKEISVKYGYQSKEMDKLWDTIGLKDSINLIKVKAIIDKYGWLGSETIGERGSSALFLVIQHADDKTQEKYLPVMRAAVKEGRARAADLALLEDRVALSEGKKQIYGSQVHTDPKTGKSSFAPIEDEPNVDKRREAMGLGPLSDYARLFNFEYHVPTK